MFKQLEFENKKFKSRGNKIMTKDKNLESFEFGLNGKGFLH